MFMCIHILMTGFGPVWLPAGFYNPDKNNNMFHWIPCLCVKIEQNFTRLDVILGFWDLFYPDFEEPLLTKQGLSCHITPPPWVLSNTMSPHGLNCTPLFLSTCVVICMCRQRWGSSKAYPFVNCMLWLSHHKRSDDAIVFISEATSWFHLCQLFFYFFTLLHTNC